MKAHNSPKRPSAEVIFHVLLLQRQTLASLSKDSLRDITAMTRDMSTLLMTSISSSTESPHSEYLGNLFIIHSIHVSCRNVKKMKRQKKQGFTLPFYSPKTSIQILKSSPVFLLFYFQIFKGQLDNNLLEMALARSVTEKNLHSQQYHYI